MNMPKNQADLENLASEMIDSIINGNIGSTIEEIQGLPKKQAIAVTALIVFHMQAAPDCKRFVERLWTLI